MPLQSVPARASRCLALATLCSLALSAAAPAQDLADEIVSYMDFATDTQGIILPEQLTQDIFGDITFVDTRSAVSHAAETIPGARHIEWREVPSRLAELPETGMVVLFCNTGVRSSQAMFAARLLGRENVFVLQSGYQGWLQSAPYRP